ncbi:hypothetical protein AB7X11_08875 [Providencia alcalifaciens]
MNDFSQYKNTLSKLKFYVYALCEVRGNTRIPFYIGKGTGSRCLKHITDAFADLDVLEENDNKKFELIRELSKENLLGIDILCHGLDSETAFMVETTCIDLKGLEGLTNKIKGKTTSKDEEVLKLGRLTIEEAASIYSQQDTEVSTEHAGLAFILNKLYRFNMSELELFEATRGVWHNPPRKDQSLKYAYAIYNDIVKEVYEIHSWVEAGTQQYFTRNINKGSGRWEFIGRKASDDIRKLYVGKRIDKDRSYGTPFVKVGA